MNVILNRVRSKVDFGDGDVPALRQALRAHGNFVEQAPIALILIGCAEAAGAPNSYAAAIRNRGA